jgi:hypothetical protein
VLASGKTVGGLQLVGDFHWNRGAA